MGTMKNTEGGLIILIHENIFQSSKNLYVQNLLQRVKMEVGIGN